MRGMLLMMCVVAAWPPAVVSAQDHAAVFEGLSGDWRGTGRLMGREARFDMRWEHRGDLAILTFRSAFVAADGAETEVLSAAALYRTSEDTPEGVWLDSRGVRVEISWRATDGTLVATWTAPDEVGRTTYRVLSASELEVVDEVRDDGGWRTFATALYRRSD